MKTFLQSGILGLFVFLCVHAASLQARLSFYHSDLLQSSQVLTDEQGTPKMISHFTPYGEEIGKVTTASTEPLFAGNELDRASELYDLGARYYDPTLSRLLTQDPLLRGLIPAIYWVQPQRWNAYAYALGNPVVLIDSEGRITSGAAPEFEQSQLGLVKKLSRALQNHQPFQVSTLDHMIYGADQLPEKGPQSVRGTFTGRLTSALRSASAVARFDFETRSQNTGELKVQTKAAGGNSGISVFEGGENIYKGVAFAVQTSSLPAGSPLIPEGAGEWTVVAYAMTQPLTNFHTKPKIFGISGPAVVAELTLLIFDPSGGDPLVGSKIGKKSRMPFLLDPPGIKGSIAMVDGSRGFDYMDKSGDEEKVMQGMQRLFDFYGISLNVKQTVEEGELR